MRCWPSCARTPVSSSTRSVCRSRVWKRSLMRTRLPRAERERQMLATAHALFAERGYGEVTMDEVASAVGVTKPLLYNYFGNKERLYAACMAPAAEALADAIVAGGRSSGTPAEALGSAIHAFFAFLDADREGWRVLFDETLPARAWVRSWSWSAAFSASVASRRWLLSVSASTASWRCRLSTSLRRPKPGGQAHADHVHPDHRGPTEQAEHVRLGDVVCLRRTRDDRDGADAEQFGGPGQQDEGVEVARRREEAEPRVADHEHGHQQHEHGDEDRHRDQPGPPCRAEREHAEDPQPGHRAEHQVDGQ